MPENEKNNEKIKEFIPKKTNKLIVLVIIFVVIVCLAALAYMNRSLFFPTASGDTIYEIGEATDPHFVRYGSDMAILTTDKLQGISQDGDVLFTHGISYGDPVMRVDGDYILVYDFNGTELSLFKGKKCVVNYTSERPIKLAKLNKSGYVAVATGSAGYKQQVILLDLDGDEIYRWLLSESYLLDIDISPDCNHLVASVISTESNIACGSIVFIDIDKESVISTTKRNDSIFPEVRYIKNNYVIAVGESEMIGFGGKGDAKWNVNYQGAILHSYQIAENGHPVLAMAGNTNNTILKMYNNRGKMTGEYELEEELKAFDCVDGRIAVALKRDVMILSYGGREKITKIAKKDIRDIVFLKKNRIIIVNADSAESVKF